MAPPFYHVIENCSGELIKVYGFFFYISIDKVYYIKYNIHK